MKIENQTVPLKPGDSEHGGKETAEVEAQIGPRALSLLRVAKG